MIYLCDDEFKAITSFMKTSYGINLTQKRPLIEGRLSNHISDLGFNTYKDYFEYVKNDKSNNEMSVLINKLTTNHTYFFRENEHFNFYKKIILPWVDHSLKTKDLRVWSAGCSSGQEPYTLAMITQDYLGDKAGSWDSTILASDISNKVLSAAKQGIYSREEMAQVPTIWIKKHFNSFDEHRFIASDSLKRGVAFRNFNLLSPFNFKKPFHTILCRNVMIYFDMPTKNELINKFFEALLPGGYLLIGHSESLSSCDHKFKYVKPSIYQKSS